MRNLYAMMGMAGALLAPSLYASMVTLTEVGGNANGGGMFQAATSGNGTFDTFCVSIDTTFTPGTSYNYAISPTIVVTSGDPPGLNYVTVGTAYLYNQFLHNNPNYAGVANADAVQATIWYFQNLLFTAASGGSAGGTWDQEDGANLTTLINGPAGNNGILQEVEAATHLSLSQLLANGNGAYGVEALNLYDSTGAAHQPQLIEVPEPTTMISGALLLLPFGASTLRILRRNRAA